MHARATPPPIEGRGLGGRVSLDFSVFGTMAKRANTGRCFTPPPAPSSQEEGER